MPGMQVPVRIRRRHYYREWFFAVWGLSRGRRRQFIRIKKAGLFPRPVDIFLMLFRVVWFIENTGH